MSVIKRILSRFGYEQGAERGDFSIGGGASSEFKIEDKGRTPLKDLEWYYWNYGPLFRGLNLKASSIWGRGFEIKTDNEAAMKLCISATSNIPGFKQWVINESLHSISYGKGPGEIIWDDENLTDAEGNFVLDEDGFIKKEKEGTKIIGYNITDPKTFEPKWDSQGYISYWIQKVQTTSGETDEIKHKPRKICFFKFHQIADNVNGIGLIETNVTTINTLMSAQKSTRELLFRHGVPFAHVKKTGATAKDIHKLKKIGTKFNSSTSLASSEKISIELHGVHGKSVDIKPHVDLLQGNLAGGLGIPKAILFFAGEAVNRATLTELMTATSVEIKTYQEKLSDIIENQIFVPLLRANDMEGVVTPQVVWNPLDEKGEAEILENFKSFTESMTKSVQVGILTPEEAKELIANRFKFKE